MSKELPSKRLGLAAVGAALVFGLFALSGDGGASTAPPAPGPTARLRTPRPAPATPGARPPRQPAPVAPTPTAQPLVRRDAAGRLVRLETRAGRTWSFERDEAGRVLASDGPQGPTTFARDAQGRVLQRTDATGRTVRLAYDHAGRTVAFEGEGARETQRFDARGRMIEARSRAGALRWSYGATPAEVVLEDLPAGVTLRYSGPGRTQTIDGPFGRTTWQRDDLGRVVGLETPAGAFRLERGAAGEPVRLVAPNGVVTRLEADARRDAVEVLGRRGSLTRLERAVDEGGRVTALTRDGDVRAARYDADGRLIAFGDEAWTWDADGNRTSRALADTLPRQATHDARGRLIAAGLERFAHDAAGRMIRRETPGRGVTSYVWDVFGRLERVLRPDGGCVEYAYDPLGRVATRTVVEPDGRRVTTRSIWEGQRLLAERSDDGRLRQWQAGLGAADDVAIGRTGDVYNVANGERIGSLTDVTLGTER